MRARGFLWFVLVAGSATVVACKHDDGMVGTATIHSGTPDGPRVTDAPLEEKASPAYGRERVRREMGDKLARTYCSHERACGLGDAETLLLAEEACFNDARAAYRASLEQWPCRAEDARDGFDECVVAIRESACSAQRGEGAQLRACEGAEICRRSDVGGQ